MKIQSQRRRKIFQISDDTPHGFEHLVLKPLKNYTVLAKYFGIEKGHEKNFMASMIEKNDRKHFKPIELFDGSSIYI